jgi:two-component system sensor kinase FixL
LDLRPGLAEVRGDRIRLQQVLLNLVTNALDAMKDAPARILTVHAAMDAPDTVTVGVGDSGPGIPEASREAVFQPFFTTKKNGLGLGLSICRSIVEEHGGRIWAHDNTGGGAAFSFTLKAERHGSA